jgi:hypothetical protein
MCRPSIRIDGKPEVVMLRFIRSLTMILTTGSLLSLAPLPANAVISTFDSDLEGWTAVGLDISYTFLPTPALTGITITGNSADMVHSATDGNPGGYAQFTDIIVEPSSLASAPGAFLGDLTSYIGGTFSFDHKLFDAGSSIGGYAPYSVILYSGAPINLNALVWSAPAPSGTTGWEHFDITLDTNDLAPIADVSLQVLDPSLPNLTPGSLGLSGTMTFNEIMADVDGILVAFELVDNQGAQETEIGGIDNVSMVPIPEPVTGGMLAFGLLGLALHARARSA